MATPLLFYKFNEASSGTAPTAVLDSSTGTALNLAITYGTGSWTSITAGNGLTFSATSGAISGSLSGTKVATGLAGITKATIECVVDTTNATNFDEIFGLQSNAFDELFVIASGGATAQILVTGPGGTSVAFDCPVGRHHLMAVLDTTQATAANRIILYVDGSLTTVNSSPTTPTYPTLNAAIDAGFTNYANNLIVAGCLTSAGTQALVGPLFAAGMYASALTSTDASAHSTALLANNDADPNAGGGALAYAPQNQDVVRPAYRRSYEPSALALPKPTKPQPWGPDPSPAIAIPGPSPHRRTVGEPTRTLAAMPALSPWAPELAAAIAAPRSSLHRRTAGEPTKPLAGAALLAWIADPSPMVNPQSPLRMPRNAGGIPSTATWAPDMAPLLPQRPPLRGESAVSLAAMLSGTLVGSVSRTLTMINLTTEGTSDWLHFQRFGSTFTKATGGGQIGFAFSGTRNENTSPGHQVVWSDGTPTTSGTDFDIGINTTAGQSITFTFPADTNPRTAVVYAGLSATSDPLLVTATLSDGSAPPYSDSETTLTDYRYAFNYSAASAGQVLTVVIRSASTSIVTTRGATLALGSPPEAFPWVAIQGDYLKSPVQRGALFTASALPISTPSAPPALLPWLPDTSPQLPRPIQARADASAFALTSAVAVAALKWVADLPVIRWARARLQPSTATVLASLIPVITPPFEAGPLTINEVDVVLTIREAKV